MDALFYNHKGELTRDTIRQFTNRECLLEPYARNETIPIAILTHYSWINLSDIVQFAED